MRIKSGHTGLATLDLAILPTCSSLPLNSPLSIFPSIWRSPDRHIFHNIRVYQCHIFRESFDQFVFVFKYPSFQVVCYPDIQRNVSPVSHEVNIVLFVWLHNSFIS